MIFSIFISLFYNYKLQINLTIEIKVIINCKYRIFKKSPVNHCQKQNHIQQESSNSWNLNKMNAIDQIAPIPPLPQVILPIPQNPPVLSDITNINSFREKASKRKRLDNNAVSDGDMASIIIHEHHVS